MSGGSVLVYLMRRDLRTSDNPVLHRLSTEEHGFTHLLPVYILPPDQIEVSGLVKDGKTSPYPPARFPLSHRWKCGHLRAKFIAESLWDLKGNLENLGSGLAIRVGTFDGVLGGIIQHYAANQHGLQVTAVWMTEDYSPDQQTEEDAIVSLCEARNVELIRFYDVKHLLHDVHLPEAEAGIDLLPDSFDAFWRAQRTEAETPLDPFPPLARSSLPSFPDHASLPPQESPFEIPDTLEGLIQKLQSPVQLPMPHLERPELRNAAMPQALLGGETRGQQRVRYIVQRGIASSYHLLSDDVHVGDGDHGLQPYLALGCITARQVHQELLKLECGSDPGLAQTLGFGRGSSTGTRSIRYHLLVLNFIRLSIVKYGSELHNPQGAGMGKNLRRKWKSSVIRRLDRPGQAIDHAVSMTQFLMGLTGFGLIDAIMRQLYITGQVTARGEEVAMGFFALYGGFDWRYCAEYVSSLSTVHDPLFYFYSSQNYACVGPSYKPKSSRISLSQLCQKVDPDGTFIRKWMPELRRLPRRQNVYRVGTTAYSLLQRYGLASSIMVTHEVPCAAEPGPIVEIPNAGRAQIETAVALAPRAARPMHTAGASPEAISEGGQFEQLGLRSAFENQIALQAPLAVADPNQPPQGPSTMPRGPSLPFRSAKTQVASTTEAPAPPEEATTAVRPNMTDVEQRNLWNPLRLHPVMAGPPPVMAGPPPVMVGPPPVMVGPPLAQLPQTQTETFPDQVSFHPLHTPTSPPSSQSSNAATLPPLRPDYELPLRSVPAGASPPPYRQQTGSGSSSPARLPAAPSPPPPPTLSSAVPRRSNTPQVPLPQEETPRASFIDRLPPTAFVTPPRRSPRRLRPRIAVIPHPALAGFLPVVADPDIVRYYIGQLRQNRFRGSSNYTFIDLPFLNNNRIHIIPCPRGVVPLRGDTDFTSFREPLASAPEDIDLEALDEFIDEVDDDEVAIYGPRIRRSRSGSVVLPPYRGRRHPSRFNSRYR
ncbi:hypothetical protein MKX08_003719 [Trichoderma sp. CBMAI-0020]|nr:hypothetical protein MKX08_003719 [Trichoderma sp. CBMAI-0020]